MFPETVSQAFKGLVVQEDMDVTSEYILPVAQASQSHSMLQCSFHPRNV